MLGLHRSSLARIASASTEAWARRCSSSSNSRIGSARAAQYGAMAGGRSGEEEGRNGGVPPSSDAAMAGVATGGVEDAYGEDRATEDQPIMPWAVCIASGHSLLRDPRHNKGMSFTEKERDAHYLRGLLPPAVLPQELQEKRLLQNVRELETPLHRYMFLMDLQERNERLFYKLMVDNVEELLPVVYTPTVGEACQKYGSIFMRPQGLYISFKDKGRVLEVLRNWPEKSIQVIVVTDGERILGLGDLGCQGMGIPVGKLALYTALGGVRPSGALPITIDVGTNNEELLNDEFYIGLRQRRATGQEYTELLDEFMAAVKQNYGSKTLVQFEDFANHNAFTLLEKYKGTHLVFNDDIQGTAAVVLAGLIAGLKFVGGTLADHKFLFFGAGEAGTGIAELVALEISMQSHLPPEEARKNIWLVDSKGLIVSSRKESIQPFKKLHAHEHEPVKHLLSAIKDIKPTALIGSAGVGQSFTKEVIQAMSSINKRPIILALSNPTSKSECTAEQAYSWSEGRAIFGSGSPFDPVKYNDKLFEYTELLDEFMAAVKQNYGSKTLVQFEDFANHNAFTLLEKYKGTHLVFNDDIQGTAAVVLAGLIAGLKFVGGTLADHKFLFFGAGEAGTGIAELVALEISMQSHLPPEEARKNIWLVDSKGLIVSSRKESIQPFKKLYAHEHEPVKHLLSAIKDIKPTALIGSAGVGQSFTKEVIQAMSSINKRPIILALSNPTSKSECTAEQAYSWSEGRAIFGSGSPFDPVKYNDKLFVPAQANNAYSFPGFGLGVVISGAIRVKDDMVLAAAEGLAEQVTSEHFDKGLIYPPFSSIRKISANIAARVAAKAYDLGLASHLPRPRDLVKYAESCMYSPIYRSYR